MRLWKLLRIIHMTIKNHKTQNSYKSLLVDKQKFLYKDQITSQNVFCGLILLKMIIGIIKPKLIVNVQDRESKLENIKLSKHNNNVYQLMTKFMALCEKIITQKGSKHSMINQRVLTILFKALSTTTNPNFNLKVKAEKSRWLQNEQVDLHKTISSINIIYKNMVAEKTWNGVDERKQQIIALNSPLKQLKTRKNRSNRSRQPNTSPKTLAASKVPEWWIKNVGPTTKDPDTGDPFTLCPHHKSRDGVVNGMYMPKGHNHDEWIEKKKERSKSESLPKQEQRKGQIWGTFQQIISSWWYNPNLLKQESSTRWGSSH